MSSRAEVNSLFNLPVMSLEYRDLAGPQNLGGARFADNSPKSRSDVELTKEEFDERIKRERADAALQAEQRVRQEYEVKLQAARASIATAISGFETQRSEYFARVEAEVVQLALAIAAKILHREALVDPMLVCALVRIAVEKMREGSTVTLRVGAGRARRWKEYFEAQPAAVRVELTEDFGLTENDCILETELGSANFGLDAQLKEVEQGFFDLLALRPVNK